MYEADCAPERIDREAAWAFLSTSVYWGTHRRRAMFEAQCYNAWRIVGVYTEHTNMVGFARSFSDGVSSAYLADVYVLPEHRGAGLSRMLITEMIDNGPGRKFRWMLHTADAHALDAKFGFAAGSSMYLERPNQFGS